MRDNNIRIGERYLEELQDERDELEVIKFHFVEKLCHYTIVS